MKIRPLGAAVIHADGQTNKHDEAKSRFSLFMRTRINTTHHCTHLHINNKILLIHNKVLTVLVMKPAPCS
jgi:GT2 family glycosyltransferase